MNSLAPAASPSVVLSPSSFVYVDACSIGNTWSLLSYGCARVGRVPSLPMVDYSCRFGEDNSLSISLALNRHQSLLLQQTPDRRASNDRGDCMDGLRTHYRSLYSRNTSFSYRPMKRTVQNKGTTRHTCGCPDSGRTTNAQRLT